MLTVFQMTLETAKIFFELCQKLNATTEAQRVIILKAMGAQGKLTRIWTTKRSKAKFIKDLSKNFNVLTIKQGQEVKQ